MVKYLLILLFVSYSPGRINEEEKQKQHGIMQTNNIYGFKVRSVTGRLIDFSSFRGKKILIVNTASECGYTPQYAELEKLYENHKEHLVIIGFPTNDFGGQEPGTNRQIDSFCKKNYGVTFPITEKITVKGPDTAPIYKWLTSKEQNGVLDAVIKWNFNKFLLDEQGHLLKKFESLVSPLGHEIVDLL